MENDMEKYLDRSIYYVIRKDSVDRKKLEEGRYNIAIILSSSADGATFSGAIGSTLYVDEIHLSYE